MKYFLLLLPLISLPSACKPAADSGTATPSGKLRILATFLPVHAHAAAIAGDRTIVESLIADDIGAHDFSPRPSDMQRIANADVPGSNGADMEPWLDDLIQQAAKKNLKHPAQGHPWHSSRKFRHDSPPRPRQAPRLRPPTRAD